MLCTRLLLQLPREHFQNGNPKGDAKFTLPSFEVDVDTRCFPLSYNHDKIVPDLQPNINILCDSVDCKENNRDVKRLACYHMFHPTCLSVSGCCPICETPLQKTAKKLSTTFNEGLLNDSKTSERTSEEPDEQSTEERESIPSTNKEYYKSDAWGKKIENTVNSYSGIKEPQFINKTDMQCESRPQRAPPQVSSIPVVPYLLIQGTHQNSVTCWRFPLSISQSTIGGRRGSNACTFISLIISKSYFANSTCNTQQLNTPNPLPQEWIYMFVLAILQGNNIYDRVTQGNARYYGVREAAQVLNIPTRNVSGEFPADLAPQPQPTAELPFYLEQAANERKTAALFIINGKTVSFVPHGGGYILIDSHIHEPHGALIAFANTNNVWDLLQFYHDLTGHPYTLGTVTKVSF